MNERRFPHEYLLVGLSALMKIHSYWLIFRVALQGQPIVGSASLVRSIERSATATWVSQSRGQQNDTAEVKVSISIYAGLGEATVTDAL